MLAKYVVTLAVVAGFLAHPGVAVADPPNLLKNGGFEDGSQHWGKRAGHVVIHFGGTPAEGQHYLAAHDAPQTNAQPSVYQDVAAVPKNAVVICDAMVRSEPGANRTAELVIWEIGQGRKSSQAFEPTQNWTRYSVQREIETDVPNIRCEFYWNDHSDAEFHIDDARLYAADVRPSYPLELSTGRDEILSKRFMETQIKISETASETGRIDGSTRIWSNHALAGFTGGVLVALEDYDGNILFPPEQDDYEHLARAGVNARPLPASSRTLDWSIGVSEEVLEEVRYVKVIHRHAPEIRITKEDYFKLLELAAPLIAATS